MTSRKSIPQPWSPQGSIEVNDGGGSLTVDGTVGISGTIPVSQSGTWAVAATQSGTWNVSDGGGSLTVDGTVAATQSGVWTVTGTGGAFPTVATTSGGCVPYHSLSSASTNATVVKASAGQLYMAIVRNNSGAVRKLAFHDTASTPTAGSGIYFTLQMSSGGAPNVYMFPLGVAFSNGIAFTTVTGMADADATAVGANELMIELFYK